jgi:hypothetical protein
MLNYKKIPNRYSKNFIANHADAIRLMLELHGLEKSNRRKHKRLMTEFLEQYGGLLEHQNTDISTCLPALNDTIEAVIYLANLGILYHTSINGKELPRHSRNKYNSLMTIDRPGCSDSNQKSFSIARFTLPQYFANHILSTTVHPHRSDFYFEKLTQAKYRVFIKEESDAKPGIVAGAILKAIYDSETSKAVSNYNYNSNLGCRVFTPPSPNSFVLTTIRLITEKLKSTEGIESWTIDACAYCGRPIMLRKVNKTFCSTRSCYQRYTEAARGEARKLLEEEAHSKEAIAKSVMKSWPRMREKTVKGWMEKESFD